MRWSVAFGLLALAATREATAATYLDAPPVGRSVAAVALYGGAPIGSANGDSRASVLGGGGAEAQYGYLWESGWSLASVFGGGRWSSRGALAQTQRDRDASITDWYAGVALRCVMLNAAELAPFASGLLLLDYARVRGDDSGDASGLATAVRVGLRWRDHPLEVYGAAELRHARLSAPYDESAPLTTTRVSLLFGVALEGAAH